MVKHKLKQHFNIYTREGTLDKGIRYANVAKVEPMEDNEKWGKINRSESCKERYI